MADLDTAAADLVVHLKGLESQIARAQHQLAELDHELAEATSHLDADWSGVEEHVQALVAKAHEEKGQLAQQGEAAEHSLGELSNAVHGAQAEQHSAMQEASAAATALAEHVAHVEPQLEPLAQAVTQTAHALAERAQAAATALEQAFAQAHELLQDQLAADLQHMQQEVEQAGEHLRALVGEQEAVDLREVHPPQQVGVGGVVRPAVRGGAPHRRVHRPHERCRPGVSRRVD